MPTITQPPLLARPGSAKGKTIADAWGTPTTHAPEMQQPPTYRPPTSMRSLTEQMRQPRTRTSKQASPTPIRRTHSNDIDEEDAVAETHAAETGSKTTPSSPTTRRSSTGSARRRSTPMQDVWKQPPSSSHRIAPPPHIQAWAPKPSTLHPPPSWCGGLFSPRPRSIHGSPSNSPRASPGPWRRQVGSVQRSKTMPASVTAASVAAMMAAAKVKRMMGERSNSDPTTTSTTSTTSSTSSSSSFTTTTVTNPPSPTPPKPGLARRSSWPRRPSASALQSTTVYPTTTPPSTTIPSTTNEKNRTELGLPHTSKAPGALTSSLVLAPRHSLPDLLTTSGSPTPTRAAKMLGLPELSGADTVGEWRGGQVHTNSNTTTTTTNATTIAKHQPSTLRTPSSSPIPLTETIEEEEHQQ